MNEPRQTLAEGRYALIRALGRGGMASVWLAHDARLDVQRAVKLLEPELGRDPEFRQRFRREAQVMARLQHPNLVAVQDFGEEGEQLYIVMELVDGGSLRQGVDSESPTQLEPALEWTRQLLSALVVVHEAGIVHRDVKPDNVLVDGSGRARLADFGIARSHDSGPRATRTGARMGTFAYMAPEQLEDARMVDARADLYAVGATLCALLTGKEPFGLRDAERRPELLAMLPEPARQLVDLCTRTRIEERPTSAAQALELLDSPAAEDASFPRWPMLAIAAAGLLGAGIFWAMPKGSSELPPAPEPLPVVVKVEPEPRLDVPAIAEPEPEPEPKAQVELQPAPPVASVDEAEPEELAQVRLGLNSQPPAELSLDGKPLGRTPWQGLLDIGAHVVELESSTGERQRLEVELFEGQPRVLCWDFRLGEECRR
jgi:serine/threonine protein kinase